MRIDILGSSSSGNGYVLQNETEALVIECGMHAKDMLKAVDYDLKKVVGAVVSHAHNDHAGCVKEYLDMGIPVLALPEVFSSHNLTGHVFAREVAFTSAYKVQNFTIQPFSLAHDVPCAGFLIKHPDLGKLMFATDTYYIPYRIADVKHYLIEANYDDDILQVNICNGKVPLALRNRLLESHMSIQNTLDYLQKQDLSQTETITLIHLSAGNSDSREFKKRAIEATGKRVVVAERGEVVTLSY